MKNVQLGNSIAIIVNTSDFYDIIKEVDINEISLEIKNEAEEPVENFAYSNIQKVDTGKYMAIFKALKTGYMRYFWSYKISNIDYKIAGEFTIKEFIASPPAEIEIGSGTVVLGSGAEIDDSITSSLKVWSSFKVNAELLKKADTTHNHDSSYYPKSTVDTMLAGKSDSTHNHDTKYSPIGHNHDLSYAPIIHNHDTSYYKKSEIDIALAGKSDTGHTHSQLHDSSLLGTKNLDETAIADGKFIAFDSASGKLIYKDAPTPTATVLKSSISFCFPEPIANDESVSFFAPRAFKITKLHAFCRTFSSGSIGFYLYKNGAELTSGLSGGPTYVALTDKDIVEGDNIYVKIIGDGLTGAKNMTVTLFVE